MKPSAAAESLFNLKTSASDKSKNSHHGKDQSFVELGEQQESLEELIIDVKDDEKMLE